MTVYVDGAENKFGRMVMCHMIADTVAELHAMADRIGLRQEWFQRGSSPHYDLSKSKRAAAVAAGAKEVDRYELVRIIRERRAAWIAELQGTNDGRGEAVLEHSGSGRSVRTPDDSAA